MPDKDGDDNKSTKSVVKKKTKQMLNQEYIPEEEYDRYRDNILMRGGDHRSKETKEKSYTPSKQPKGQTAAQKAAKGKSALELVKADITKKYGKGAIMNVGKKKVKEELDLTKIAEAFGGYVVEANGKNGKKNNKKRDSIDDFIDADDPFNVQAQKDAQRDIEQTGGTDTRSSFTRQDSFQKSGKFKQPETNPLRKKDGNIKPGSVKFTQRPGEAPVKITRDPSVIDPKFAKKKTPKPKVDVEDQQDYKKAAKSFKKDIGGEKIISPTMQDRLEKATKGPRKARRRRSDAASFAKVKADIDMADAARKANKRGEYADDYEKRLDVATGKSLEGTTQTGRVPAGRPLPATPKGIKGEPQKDRPRAQKPPEGTYSRVGGQREVIGNVDTKVTGGEYGRLRSGQTADQTKLNQALTGRDAEGNPLTPAQRKELMKQSRGTIDSDAVKNVSKNLTKGAMPPDQGDSTIKKGGRFDTGREGESISMRPKPESPNVTVNTPSKNPLADMMTDAQKRRKVGDAIGKETTKFASDKLKQQSQSLTGAMGGLLFKTAFPASAGLEAGIQFDRGDKLGGTLSALQSMGGGLGFGAGVLNALRMRSPGYTPPAPRPRKFDPRSPGPLAKKGQVRMDRPKGEREAMMGVGGVMLSKVLQNVRRAAQNQKGGLPVVRGGRVGRRSAPS